MAYTYQNTDIVQPGTALTMANGDTLVLAKDRSIASSDGGSGISLNGNSTIYINGTVAGSVGIVGSIISSTLNLTIGQTGSLIGSYSGINTAASSYAVINRGSISGFGSGSGGALFGGYGDTAQNSLINYGSIDGVSNGVQFFSSAGAQTTFANFGAVSAAATSGYSVTGSSGSDSVTNYGTLNGNVQLNAGNDTFVVGVGSTINGSINGGLGSDTISFANHGTGVRVDLPSGLTWDGQITLVVSNFENAVGTSFNDVFIGNASDNIFDAGPGGADQIFGYGGNDTVSFASSSLGVRVDMPSGASFDGVNTDYFSGIENIIGSRGNDIIIGDGADNTLDGGPGGLDQILGGAGNDTLSYASSESSVRIDLPSGVSYDGFNTDYFNGIENLTGSRFSDTLIGDNNANVITGGAGFDSITTGGGADRVIMSSLSEFQNTGSDTITDFAASLDKLVFASAAGFSSSAAFVSGSAPVAGNSSPTFLYNTGTGLLSYDSDGNGATGAISVASLTNKPTLGLGDLQFV